MAQPVPFAGRRLKILYLSQIDVSRRHTGSATRIQQVVTHLCRRHEVHLVHVEAPGDPVADAVPPGLPPGLASVTAVPRRGRGSRLFNLALFRAAAAIAEARDVDLAVVEFGEAGAHGAALRILRGLPFVYMSQNVEHRLHLQRSKPTPKRIAFTAYLALVEWLSVRLAALTTTVTAVDAEVFRAWRPARVKVLPVGFSPEAFNPFGAVADDPPRLVFFGNLAYAPNREAVEFIARAVMPAVLARRPDAVFQFIGAHEPDLPAKVPGGEFVGFAPDLPARLRRARLVLVPVMTGGGMRMKTVEALACGKMVLAAGRGADGIDVGAVRRLRLVEPEAFAEAVLDELERGVAEDDVDFDYLKARFSTDAILAAFEEDLLRAARRPAKSSARPLGWGGRSPSLPAHGVEEPFAGLAHRNKRQDRRFG